MITVKLNIVDESGKLLAGVFSFYKSTGVKIADIPAASGTVTINDSEDDQLFADGVYVRATAPGYSVSGTSMAAVALFNEYSFTVKKSANITALAVIAIAGTAAVLHRQSRPRVGAIDVKRDVLPWLPVVAIGVGGLLLYNKIFGQTAEDAARDAAINADIQASGTGYLSDSQIATMANAIENDLNHVGADTAAAAREVTKVVNLNDLLRLIKAYGSRMIYTLGIPRGHFTLEATISDKFADWEIQNLNDYLQAQGINFKF